MLEHPEFPDDKTRPLMAKNRIGGSVGQCVFAAVVHIGNYQPAKGNSATVLDLSPVTCPADAYLGSTAPHFSNSGAELWRKRAIVN
jgi:hypothetical protein